MPKQAQKNSHKKLIKMYRLQDKMCELMAREPDAIRIISRFGLTMGVGEKTIEEVCREHGVHCPTFLAVVNYKTDHVADCNPEDIDIDTLRMYLRNAHAYFIDFQMPRIRRDLIEAINPADTNSQIPMLILRFYDEYVQEIRTHIEHENEGIWEQHAQDDQNISFKFSEIKNLIIKYYPSQTADVKHTYAIISVMNDLFDIEQDFSTHCSIEDDILVPALELDKKRHNNGRTGEAQGAEELSDREKDVLIQLVKGLSNKEIADVLCISTHTVITHRKNITRKLNIHSTAGLTIYAIVNHLVDLEQLKTGEF